MITILISVFDKTGLVDYLTKLKEFDQLRIIATSSTAQFLQEHQFECTNVESLTKFPEILGGRVKTLHPKIFGGILSRDIEEDERSLSEFDIWKIDMVIVNLYPFTEKLKDNLTEAQMVEYIDIGGVSLIRAAAKNFKRVTILCQSHQFAKTITAFATAKGEPGEDFRRALAREAFEHTSTYDNAIASYFLGSTETNGSSNEAIWPKAVNINLKQYQTLRYGENPHQAAAWCVNGLSKQESSSPNKSGSDFPPFTQLQGKDLSANNITDTYCLVKILREISQPSACIIKHNNPCGVALGKTIEEAFDKAYNTDAKSAFGGIYGFSTPVSKALAEKIVEGFVEIVLAPAYDKAAIEIFQTKKNLRILQIKPTLLQAKVEPSWHWQDLEDFGWIVERDMEAPVHPDQFQLVAGSASGLLENQYKSDVAFAWAVVKHLTSNAIFVAKDGCSLGFGIGQTSRIASVEIALAQAGSKARGAVMASDAFFPATDNIETAAKAGISVIVQPGGSVKDKEVIAACEQAGIKMLFTGQRCFRH
jgi:phosphoribosylaminoimidazolecarboxamide formyltransferase / IMP cyclohydrolase